jgi:hypothetical protein
MAREGEGGGNDLDLGAHIRAHRMKRAVALRVHLLLGEQVVNDLLDGQSRQIEFALTPRTCGGCR